MLFITTFELPRQHLPGKFLFQEINYGQSVSCLEISEKFAEFAIKKERKTRQARQVKQEEIKTFDTKIFRKPSKLAF